jgi:hypothetical protein
LCCIARHGQLEEPHQENKKAVSSLLIALSSRHGIVLVEQVLFDRGSLLT